MSDGGTDNPAFSNDECQTSDNSNSNLENSHTESLQNSQITVESDYRTPVDEASSATQKIENGHQQSFVSQHYVEPIRTSPEPQYKTETRIELPADNQEKLPSPTKSNGIHGNGNNNDASFLNTSTASIQSNDGKKEQVEAVNLELVSMRPYSGANAQSKGQEACEVPADPYEEYFVPVNEHRKYIRSPDAEVETTVAGVRFDLGPGLGREGLSLRDPTAGLVDYSHWLNALRGEKLYVTKDKRSRSSYWRRIACWGCGLLVLALAVIIAILAATGVILTQEATQPLESDGHTSSRQFSDIKTSGSQEYIRNPPISPPPEVSSFPPWPTTDETPYEIIPQALEGMLTLDDLTWSEDMDNPKSRVYRDVSQEIEENLKDMLHLAENLSVVKVYNISSDGEVKFRISYPPVSTPEQMQTNIEKMLQKSGSMVGKYHLSKLNIAHLIDDCKRDQLNCSESCRYDYSEGSFVCFCFAGRKLELDGKTCLDENDLSNVDMDEDIPHEQSTEFVQDAVQGRSRGPETTPSPKHQEFDHAHAQFEETTEVDQISAKSPEIFGQPEPQPSSEPGSEPEPTGEPKSEPASEPSPALELEPKVEPTAEAKAEPEPSAEPQPTAEPKAEPEPSVEAEPTAEPKAEPEPSVEPEPAAEPKAEPEPSVEPEPTGEPKAEPEPSVEPEPTGEPKVEPEPSVEPEPTGEPKVEPEPSVEPEPAAEPEAEPVPSVEPEPTAEPKSEPEPSFEPNLEPQSKGEPTPEPDTTAEPEPTAELKPEISLSAEPKSEPTATVEPISEPQPSSEPEAGLVPAAEPQPEPGTIAEPGNEPDGQVKPQSETPNIAEKMADQDNTAMQTNSSLEPTTELANTLGFPGESIEQTGFKKLDTPIPTSLPKSDDIIGEQTEPSFSSESHLETEQNAGTMGSQNQTEPIFSFSNIEPETEYKPSQNESDHGVNWSVDPVSPVDTSQGMSRGFDSNNNDTYLVSHPPLQFENNSYSGPANEPEVPQVESSNTNQFLNPSESLDASEPILHLTVAPEVPLVPVTEIIQPVKFENEMETNAQKSAQAQGVFESTGESRSKVIPDYESFFDSGADPITSVVPTTIEPLASAQAENTNENNGLGTAIKPEMVVVGPESTAKPSSMTEPSLTMMNGTEMKAIDGIPSTSTDEAKLRETTEYNVIEHMPSTVYQTLPKLIGENIKPLIDSAENSTSSEDQHIMIISNAEHATQHPMHSMIPELSPEQIGSNHPTENSVHSDSELDNIPKTNAEYLTGQADPYLTVYVSKPTTIQPEHSVITEHPLHPIVFAENSVEHHSDKIELSEEKHVEDMSPVLPDVQHEKEISKKAPRLDKDEQDVPNPFETRVPDVILHHPHDSTSNLKLQSDSSSVELNGSPNEVHEMLNDTASGPAFTIDISNQTNIDKDSHYAEDKRNQVPTITTGPMIGYPENGTEIDSEKESSDALSKNTDDSEEKPVRYFSETNSLNDSVHIIGNTVSEHDFHKDNQTQAESHYVGPASNDSTLTDIRYPELPSELEEPNSAEEVLRVIPLGEKLEISDAMPVKLQNANTSQMTKAGGNEVIEVSTQKVSDSIVNKELVNKLSDEQRTGHSDKSILDYTERNVEDQYNDIVDEADSNLTKHFENDINEHNNRNILTPNNTSNFSNIQNVTVAQVESDLNSRENNQPITEQSTEHNEVSQSAYTESNAQATTKNTLDQVSSIFNSPEIVGSTLDHHEPTTMESISGLQTTILPDTIIHDHFTDVKLTTQVPILPVEIEQTASVTETVHNGDQITITENHIYQQSNDTRDETVGSVDTEQSTATIQPSTSIHGSNFESNTTAQIPILPDELQTTENEIYATTPSVKILQNEETTMNDNANKHEMDQEIERNDKLGIVQNISTPTTDATSEANTVSTVQDELLLTDTGNSDASENENLHSEDHSGNNGEVSEVVKTFNETGILQANATQNENTEMHTDNMSTHTENGLTNLETPTFSTENMETQRDGGIRFTTQSPTTTTNDIRPVSEAIIDDFKPYQFDYKQLFPSTEKAKLETEEELSDEDLRVIPLEKQDIKKKSTEKKTFDKYKHKKEKELSFEDIENTDQPVQNLGIPTSTMLSVEIPPTVMTEAIKNEPSVEQEQIIDNQTMLANTSYTRTIIPDDIRPVSEVESEEMIPSNNTSEAIPPRTDSEIHLVDNETHTHISSMDDLISRTEDAKNTVNKTIEETVQKIENIATSSNISFNGTVVQADVQNISEILESASNTTAQTDVDVTIQNLTDSISTHAFIANNDTKIDSTELGVPQIDRNPMQDNSTVLEPINEDVHQISDADQQSSAQSDNSDIPIDIASRFQNNDEIAENPATEFANIPTSFVENVKPSTEVPIQLPTLLFSKCTAGQFQCINGTSRDGAYCVSLAAKCDSENDCSDGSDEVNCEQEGCPGNFQCSSGQCLKRHLVCNGIKDCDDGSDEKSCEAWRCQFDEFQCPNGRCIPILWQCNGRPDCENHKDEYSCAESCGNNEYLCPTEKWCIPLTWHCNGIPECAHGEDEKLCDCALDQFKCQTGGCVSLDMVCDGVEHCPDHSDEWDCLVANLTVARNSTEVQKDDDNEGHGDTDLVGQATILKIRQPNGERRLVCSDNWTTELSDSYCKALGYFSSESTDMLPLDEGMKLLKLKPTPDLRAPLVTNLEPANVCETGKIVQISCQEFSCGSHYPEGPTARIAGGTPAGEGQWSSVALLKEQKYGVACTASVLSPMHALASYSCIHKYRQSRGWQLFTGGDTSIPHSVKNIVPYPQVKYNQFLYNNDMALVELEQPLIFSRNVSAVCLPRHPIQPRQLCVTAGWGFPMNGEVNLKQYLKFLPVPTYDSEECNATSHYAGFITKDNICAGFTDTDKGPCYNDEGAPLMCASETGRWELHGLLSHHSRCSRGHPAIYSSLAPALSWLHHSIPALQARP